MDDPRCRAVAAGTESGHRRGASRRAADALAYLKRFDITYANGPDIGTRIGPLYRITGVPETFIVERGGNVAFFKVSPVTQAELSAVLEQVLEP